MFGFVLGTVCLVGLIGMGRHHHRHLGRGCGPHGRHHRGGPWGHHRWHGRGRWGGADWEPEWVDEGRRARRAGVERAVAEMLKRSLHVDEDQEPFVDHAMKDGAQTLEDLKEEVASAREDLAKAFRGETVDDAAVDAAFSRVDEAFKKARRELVSAAKQVHAVLDPEQRAAAADALSNDARWGF